jgi:hypothetical protein
MAVSNIQIDVIFSKAQKIHLRIALLRNWLWEGISANELEATCRRSIERNDVMRF